jgi:hypothetical protein
MTVSLRYSLAVLDIHGGIVSSGTSRLYISILDVLRLEFNLSEGRYNRCFWRSLAGCHGELRLHVPMGGLEDARLEFGFCYTAFTIFARNVHAPVMPPSPDP